MADSSSPTAKKQAALFTAGIFLSATLLFMVQPMVARLLLPLLGGASSVWNTCMVFFQLLLLMGYSYSFILTRYVPPTKQWMVHLVVLAIPWLTLPIHTPETAPATASSPLIWLLGALSTMVALPFFALSTTSPLLQRWFSYLDHPDADEPTFLYAASNVGSMLALIGFPLLIEPLLTTREQSLAWTTGFAILAILILAAGVSAGRAASARETGAQADAGPGSSGEVLTWKRRGMWLLLSLLPSSALLGVTGYLTTDIASFPLLWVIPLALYLLTFVLVFARRARRPGYKIGRITCLVATFLTVTIVVETIHPTWLILPAHLLLFFLLTWIAHGRLADDTPSAEHLPQFYFWMSLGGVLGGAMNTFIAPALFDLVWEYPIVIAALCMLRTPADSEITRWREPKIRRVLDFAMPILTGVVTLCSVLLVGALGYATHPLAPLLSFGVPVLVAYYSVERPVRFGAGLLALCAVGMLTFQGQRGQTLETARNFFGVVRVMDDPGDRFRVMFHGSTDHGRQRISARDACEPLQYFHREGPMGDFLEDTRWAKRVAVVGLGAGSLACYARPDQAWTFFEINPAVIQMAKNPDNFTFLENSSAASITHVLGDARVEIANLPEGQQFDILIIDAFSSDAIPMHLLTIEAFELYNARIARGGVLAIHISNRVFEFLPIIANLAKHADMRMAFRVDDTLTAAEVANGRSPSIWVALSRDPDQLTHLNRDHNWLFGTTNSTKEPWSDDYANILSAIPFDLFD